MKRPKILYKYRTWDDKDGALEYQRKILTDNEIYLSRANQFNDPFDSSLPFQYRKRDNRKRKIYKKMLQVYKKRNPSLPDSDIKRICKEKINTGFYKDEDYKKQHHKQMVEDINNEIGIFSLSKSNNNILMWSHYADSHKGYCIGFDTKALYNLQVAMGPITYSDSFPKLSIFPKDDAKDFLKLLTTKSNDWAYEFEYRMISTNKERRKIYYPDECIKEIIFGCNMSHSDKESIIDIIKTKQSNISLFEASKSSSNYDLNIIEMRNI